MISSETNQFEIGQDRRQTAYEIMAEVMTALEEKGYNPINQMVGYFLSGDPTYITNHNGARGVIRRMERDELLEVILRDYVERL
ncbi:MAG TPA: IreB family regulatory phosphoprotein [Clostridiaceae bacterium]|nr:IreB family regulatory phosphoprotein [Clostridiaceae bacterium]